MTRYIFDRGGKNREGEEGIREKTYSIHWVDTIAVTNNSQKSSTYTPKWIELSIDRTNVPTYQPRPFYIRPSFHSEDVGMTW
jgi:hypothetical protein